MDTLIAILISVVSSFLFLFLIFLFLIAPRKSKSEEMKKYTGIRYAHRGLHDEKRPENSLAAFAAAVDAGYGIELDVRLSADGVLVVFHDDTLDRMTAESGRVDKRSLAELKEITLAESDERIPEFAEVLRLVDGRVPLLVEIKEDAGSLAVTRKTAEMLSEYEGDYIIESFNPLAIAEIKRLLPDRIRGVLSQNFIEQEKYRAPLYFLLQCLFLNVVARPDFIAFDHNGYKNFALKAARGILGATTIAWTTRTEDEDAFARAHGFDTVIFENYTPNVYTEE